MTHANPIDLRDHLSGEYRSYFGRGMMGQSCQGYVYDTQRAAIMDMICATSNAPDDEPLYDALSDHRFDSMGTDVILYFPSVGTK